MGRRFRRAQSGALMQVTGLSPADAALVESWLLDNLRIEDLRELVDSSPAAEHALEVLAELRGKPKRRTRRALSREVVATFGSELLMDSARRQLLLNRRVRNRQKRKELTVGRWHPGKHAARAFVSALGLPEVLAGEPSESAPSIEEVDAFPPLGDLHPYQLQIRRQMLAALQRTKSVERRGVVWLPTGTGKTRVTVETLLLGLDLVAPRNCILWIADREELCEQAVSDFRHVWMQKGYLRDGSTPPLRLTRLWGQRSASDPPTIPTVIVASIQKLARGLGRDEGFEEWLDVIGRRCAVVVLDEAHKSGSPTYVRVLRALGLHRKKNGFRRNYSTGAPLFGLTATPVRGSEAENKTLRSRFGRRLIEPGRGFRTLAAFEKGGYLSKITGYVVPTKYQLTVSRGEREHWETFGTLARGVINRAGQDPHRTAEIVRDLEGRLKKLQSVLVFACSVQHAHAMATVLSERGVKARALDGGTSRGLRHAVIDSFKRKEFQVLINCDLLATGFDAPNVDCVAIARPVGSQVLYAQMVGRGLRGVRNGGTPTCLVLDYEDSAGPYGDLDGFRRDFRKLWKGP